MFLYFGRVDDSSAYKYIDCFNGGRFLSEKQCLDLLYSPMTNTISVEEILFVRATPRQVIEWLECIRTSYNYDDFTRKM